MAIDLGPLAWESSVDKEYRGVKDVYSKIILRR